MFGLMRVTLTSAGRFRRSDGTGLLLSVVGLSEGLRNVELPGWAGLSHHANSLSPLRRSRSIRASIPCPECKGTTPSGNVQCPALQGL